MAIIRLNNIDDEVSELLRLAAKRKGMLKHSFIEDVLTKVAQKEKATQQEESK
jgi:hypothetical protein